VATYAKSGGIFNNQLTAHLLLRPSRCTTTKDDIAKGATRRHAPAVKLEWPRQLFLFEIISQQRYCFLISVTPLTLVVASHPCLFD